ncbi:hypothetical protein QBC44DRAFT_356077 [Cladorrhinum sp. PSN332]|nr:hypothetical protein QBC44DRAFT_356077 [Cladorrhinum sp. PSN332]
MSTNLTSESFQRSLERFRSRLSDDQKKDFQMVSIDEVKVTIGKIQDKIGPEKELRNLARLRGFLEGMKQVEDLVTIFLNVSEVVAFVWGPIKLALLMASAHFKTLEVLIDTYEDIGNFIEGISQLDRLFKNYSGARQILEGCFDDILRFHQVALEELTRPNWKKLADCLWPQIKKRFDPILKSLQNRKILLSEGKLAAAIEEIQDARQVTLEKLQEIDTLINACFDKTKEIQQRQHSELLDHLLKDKGSIFAKLDAPDYQGDQQSALTQRHDITSGSWILQDPKFKEWVAGSLQRNAVLYINGMPGSDRHADIHGATTGKTTLASTIINHLKSNRDVLNGNVAFFYFKHRREETNTKSMVRMLRAIVSQLLDQDNTLLGPLQAKCGSLGKSDVIQEPFLKALSKDCIALQRRCWIVLDGLDECDGPGSCQGIKSKALEMIDWFWKEILPPNPLDNCPVRVIFSAQRDGQVDQKLAGNPSINLDAMKAHLVDVQRYIDLKTAEIATRFSLDSSTASMVAGQVASTARGMFLYAKVVLDNLLSQDSVEELKEELSAENFPEGLKAAYERVVIRILDRPSPPRRRTAKIILGWLVCSPRPLRWREIQSKFCIKPKEEVCNYDYRRLDNGKVLCGSLVELSHCEYQKDSPAEDWISLVHETARSYLVQSGRFSLAMEHAQLAIFCTQYLASTPFSTHHTAERIEGSALAGYYGLLDYAATQWKEHVKMATASSTALGEELRSTVRKSAEKLLQIQAVDSRPHDQTADATTPEPEPVLNLVEFIAEDRECVILSQQICLIRETIEMIEHTQLKNDVFSELNGHGLFKCSNLGCLKFTDGFLDQKDRHRHLLEHERPFKCSVEGCYAKTVGYSSQKDLDVHCGRVHPSDSDFKSLFLGSKSIAKEDTIYTAASKGNLEQVKLFQASGAPINEPDKLRGARTPLFLAVKHGHADVCRYLIQELGVDPFQAGHGLSPLYEAIVREDSEIVRIILSTEHTWVHSVNSYILQMEVFKSIAYAICSGNVDIVDQLLQFWRRLDRELRRILSGILQQSYLIKRQYATRKAALFERQKSLLHTITQQAFPTLYCPGTLRIQRRISSPFDKQELKLLHGILTNQGEPRGYTPLHEACAAGLYYVADFLLDFLNNQDLLIVNADKETSVHCLVGRGIATGNMLPEHALDLLRRLLEATNGAVAMLKDNLGNLPLHIASRRCSREMLELLIQHTGDLDDINNEVQTPLERAIEASNDLLVELLLQKDERLEDTTSQGESMHSLARRIEKEGHDSDGEYSAREREGLDEARKRIVELLKSETE